VRVHEDTPWRDSDRYGDTNIDLLDGNHIIYGERHHSERTTLDTLEQRLIDCIDMLCERDDIGQCDACNGLYIRTVDRELCEQTFSWADRHIFTHGLDPRYKAAPTTGRAQTCVYATGRLFDTLHIITHHWDVNPFYSDEQLVACESLNYARGLDRSRPDGEPRSFDEIDEKYMDITRVTPQGRDAREKREEMLDLLDWVLQRADRFRVGDRFKVRIHR
jgi:hypothetical protein